MFDNYQITIYVSGLIFKCEEQFMDDKISNRLHHSHPTERYCSVTNVQLDAGPWHANNFCIYLIGAKKNLIEPHIRSFLCYGLSDWANYICL